jgi:putative holliday junction resolvase
MQVMAFDFGLCRIGVAIGNTEIKIAHPLDTITGQNKFDKLDKIAKLVAKWKPLLFVIGKPAGLTDKAELLAGINKFANRLRHKFNLAVEFINEDYTSSLASGQLNEQNVFGRKQHEKLDQLSACAILETYFNNCRK